MLLREEQLISLFKGKVGLEGDVERQEDSKVGESSDISQLECTDPLQNAGVFVNNLSLFEVQAVTRELGGHLNEGLVEVGRMVDILFELEESVNWSSEELGMSEAIGDVLVLLLWLDGDIVLVSLSVVVVVGDWPVQPLLLPLYDVFELRLLVPGGVGDKPVLVLEGPLGFFGQISPGESEVGQIGSGWSVGAEVGVDARNSAFVGAVELGNGVPDLSLDLEIMFELIDDPVVLEDLGFVMILIKLVMDVLAGVRILMGQCWIGLIVDIDIFFEEFGVGLLLGVVEQRERVVGGGAEAGESGDELAGEHPWIYVININRAS